MSRPRLIEGVGIVHREGRFQHLAAVDDFPAFDDVQLVGMRRAVNIEHRLVVQPNGIDDKRVALIVADRLAVP